MTTRYAINRQVFLQVVPVKVTNNQGKSALTYALLDGGSQCTIIRKNLCQNLKLGGEMQRIKIGTIKDIGTSISTKIVDMEISSLDGQFKQKITNVYSVDEQHFNIPGQALPVEFKKDKAWQTLKNLNICDVKSQDIEMLIGADIPAALLSKEIKNLGSGMPLASKTQFGWSLIGAYEKKATPNSDFIAHCNRTTVLNEDLNNLVTQFWDIESFGTEVDIKTPLSVQDQNALHLLERDTKLIDGHYVVPMIWNDQVKLPNSINLAKRRLDHLARKFKSDPEFFKMYNKNIQDYIKLGYARKLTVEEASQQTPKTWYLPHHGVVSANKPGKVRIVFDAAATVNGTSLNSNLRTGPDLLNSLIGILMRFRKYPIAITGDIEAMFHQVKLKVEDRESVRFLWRSNPSEVPDHYQMLGHIFGAKDSPCCACYALRKTASDNKECVAENVTETIYNDFYMDDLIKSVNTEEEAIQLIKGLSSNLHKGGFNLTKFTSNSTKVIESLPTEKCCNNAKDVFESKETSRTLGIKWNIRKDAFTYDTKLSSVGATKRIVLKVTSTIFDPLGFLTPFVLRAKLLIQHLWRTNQDWDDPIDLNSKEEWENWKEDLQNLSKIEIPRCISVNENYNIQLHVFCDASELAYAVASYIRISYPDKVVSHLVMSKSRVAPLKVLTLPRLELQGAVMAVRVKEMIIKEMAINFHSIHFWTDSTLNLQYIRNESKRFKVFVANRISEIRLHSNPLQWHYIPGKLNPADLATRGLSLKELCSIVKWWNGPKMLYDNESEWKEPSIKDIDPENEEIRNSNPVVNITIQSEPLICYERFSNWKRLVNCIAWVLIYINKVKTNSQELYENELLLKKKARTTIFRLIQEEVFKEEIQQLKLRKMVKRTSSILNLDPFLDDENILRVGGRLKYGKIPYAAKHQIVLPSSHYAVQLLVKLLHVESRHVGREHLLSIIRQEFWIIKGRRLVASIISKCLTCKMNKAQPSQTKMADLPTDRIAIAEPPFFNTGVDYFGPILVKVLRSQVKRWGCIFTCLSTRAIHLEVAPSLQTDDFLNVLRRFINRRGCPKTIRSDCGTNFKGANNFFKQENELMNTTDIQHYATQNNIEWIFNPPEAPHMGGAWERLIRSVKTTMRVITANRVVSDSVLHTILTEVEVTVNGRPLTYYSDDINDLEPLTPNHFLIGRANQNRSPCITYSNDVDHRRRYKQVQAFAKEFWDRWISEYLPSLTKRSKWFTKRENVNVGELVLLLEKRSQRGNWPLARITKTYKSDDGLVRKVELKTKDGTFVRPITKVARLEIEDTSRTGVL